MTATPVSTTANLGYLVPPEDGSRAYQRLGIDPSSGEKTNNYGVEQKSVVIENIRGKEDSVTLDTNGFQFYKHTSKHMAFDNDEEIRREYYSESIELIKNLTGASRVEVFDHTIRRRIAGKSDLSSDPQPIARVHVDQTSTSAIARVHRHLPASDVPKLLERRFQIINLWRPIAHPAIDWPLTICDTRSFDIKQDAFPIDLIQVPSEGPRETMGVQYNENHKWKYLHGMTPEEIVLFKCADSIQDGSVSMCAPHTGFCDPTTPEGTPLRQSIELRALVFYD